MKVEFASDEIADIHSALTERLVRTVDMVVEAQRAGAYQDLPALAAKLDRHSAALQLFEEVTGYRPTTIGVRV